MMKTGSKTEEEEGGVLIVPLVFTFVSINIPHKLARGMCVCVFGLALYEIGLLLLTQNGGNAFFSLLLP